MFWHKLKLFWDRYWVWVSISCLVALSLLIPLWYLPAMEENTRKYILAMQVAALPYGVFQTLIFVGLLYIMQFSGGFAMFKKSCVKAEAVNIKFTDVIGLGQAKREAWEVVQLISDRRRVASLGGKILRGVLLVGPPGCGKTLLAKAIATEAGVPFLSVSGAEFVEVFVGVGASRVRRLFALARSHARAYGACIVFIDELEVIGRHRILHDAFGGGAETNSTQNQLLVELDGLGEEDANVIVIGATNAGEDILDEALLRPGRFDRKIFIGRPNLQEREQLFAYYLKKIKYDSQIDVARLARKAVRKTPAEIENIIKEAALIAARNRKDFVTYKEFSEAVERIELGVEHRLNLTPREKEMTAYHEAGHVLALYLTHPVDDVFKVSIRQRGGTLGVVHSVPREELYACDRDTLLAHIRVALGGYAAEKIKYGVTTDGVSADFTGATTYAHNMVWRLGMGESGLVGNFASIPQAQLSDAMTEKLNWETQRILSAQLAEVEKLLQDEWVIVEELARALVQKEELDFDEVAEIFTRHGKPQRQAKLPADAPIIL